MMARKEIKNVLVLGTEGVKTSRFCKLFEAYLCYDSYEDAEDWNPQLFKDTGNCRPSILLNNLKLISTPDLEASFISKQIIYTLSKFQDKQRLNAIIILLEQNPEGNVHLNKLKGFLFHILKQYSENILYVYELDYQNQEQMNIFGGSENIFYLNTNTFYDADEAWFVGVDLCNTIYNYIDCGNKNGLKNMYIQNDVSNKILSNLIDNLLELLLQIYILNNIKHFIMVNGTYEQHLVYISEYKRNVTVCFGDSCIKTITYYDHNSDENINTKVPKICHASCNCGKTNTKCKIFETPNSTCMQCNCTKGFHSNNYFKSSSKKYSNAEKENKIAITTLAIFYLFKKQEQGTIDFKEIFSKFLNLDETNANTIFNSFNNEFNKKLKAFENYCLKPFNILNSIMDLYKMKETGKIIPTFVEEIFPKDVQLKLQTNVPNNESMNETSEIYNAKLRIRTLTDEFVELKRIMGNILNSKKNYATEDDVNDLNSQIEMCVTPKDISLNIATNEIKNVLVLGTEGVNSRQFCKLFEAYLSYDSFENAVTWQPKLEEDDGINRSTIFVNNLKLICIPNVEISFISKQIISILSNFQNQQSLNAVIILLKQNREDDDYLMELQNFLFNVLQKLPDNILYISELNSDSYQCQKTIKEQLNVFRVKNNIFYLNENIFYKVSANNWTAGVKFCNTINNYIDDDRKGLPTISIQNDISQEILLYLINNLTELLILIYILNSTKEFSMITGSANTYEQRSLFIGKFKRNVTVCYGKRCARSIRCFNHNLNENVYRREPKICHASCSCINANRDVTKCIIFETPITTCTQCDCCTKFHSQNYFKFFNYKYVNVEDESQVALEVLAKFSLFKKQETLNFQDIFSKFLYLDDSDDRAVFESFNNEINEKVKLNENNSVNPIDILISIEKLYDMKNSGKIIPKFIEELLPKDFRLETITPKLEKTLQTNEPSVKTLCDISEIDDAKMKIQMQLGEVEGFKHMIDNNKDDVAEENANNLNSHINQDETSKTDSNLTSNEKEINWNIKEKEDN